MYLFHSCIWYDNCNRKCPTPGSWLNRISKISSTSYDKAMEKIWGELNFPPQCACLLGLGYGTPKAHRSASFSQRESLCGATFTLYMCFVGHWGTFFSSKPLAPHVQASALPHGCRSSQPESRIVAAPCIVQAIISKTTSQGPEGKLLKPSHFSSRNKWNWFSFGRPPLRIPKETSKLLLRNKRKNSDFIRDFLSN